MGRGIEVEEGDVGIEEHWENGNPPVRDARLPVTQPDDPPDLVISGGHFSVGTLKTPPGPAREGGVIIIQVKLRAFDAAHSEHSGSIVGPHHSNAPTVGVGGVKTRYTGDCFGIGHHCDLPT